MTAETPEVTPNQEEEQYHTPKWLVVMVIVLGAAIIAMIGIMVTMVINKTMAKNETEALQVVEEQVQAAPQKTAMPVATTTASAASQYLLNVEAPEGGTFVDMAGGGADAILRFRHEDGSWTLVVFDTRKGVERGRVKVK